MGTALTMHLSEELIEEVDRALGSAIMAVERGEAADASVALSFKVALDDDCKPDVTFTHKHTTTRKGSLQVARQDRLPLED